VSDTFAWRASDEFAAAFRQYQSDKQAFIDSVVLPFDREHRNNPTAWRRAGFSLDIQCCGFKDKAGKVPAGLSRARTRRWLIPVRGKAGNEWRAVQQRMVDMPSLDKVFQAHDLAPFVLVGNTCATPGWFSDGTNVFIECTGDIAKTREDGEPSKHLKSIKLSEFHAAKESWEVSCG
jgi:hypothetical protein